MVQSTTGGLILKIIVSQLCGLLLFDFHSLLHRCSFLDLIVLINQFINALSSLLGSTCQFFRTSQRRIRRRNVLSNDSLLLQIICIKRVNSLLIFRKLLLIAIILVKQCMSIDFWVATWIHLLILARFKLVWGFKYFVNFYTNVFHGLLVNVRGTLVLLVEIIISFGGRSRFVGRE